MSGPEGNTIQLLRRWHNGDSDALNELVTRNLAWVSRRVRKSLGPELRGKFETQDLVQDAMLQVLEYGPRFDVDSERLFRALIARIVTNDIRDRHRWAHRQRRARNRERVGFSDTVLKLDPPAQSVTRPSQAVQRDERRAWVRLALDFMEPEDREVLKLRVWESRSFPEIGELLGLTPDAVRMRTKRALARLATKFEQLLDRSALRSLEVD